MAVALLSGIAATHIRIDTGVENLLVPGDPARVENRALKTEFSNDEVIVVAFDLGHRFGADDLRGLREISRRVGQLPGVDRVLDLSNAEDVRGDGSAIDASPLVDFAVLDQELDAIRERIRGHRLYRRALVADDQHALAMIVFPVPFGDDRERVPELTEEVLRLAAQAPEGWRAFVTGYPVAEYEANRIVRRDLTLLTGVAFVAIAGVMFLATRRLFAVALLVLLVGWSELVTHGFLGATGTPLSVVTSTLPTLVLASSSTYAIYFAGLLQRVSDRGDPGLAVLELLTRPVLVSWLSTAIGFLSLLFIRVEAIGELGAGLSVGITAAALGTLLLLPVLVRRFDVRLEPVGLSALEKASLLGVRFARRPWFAIGAAAMAVAVSVPGIQRIVVHSDVLDYFDDDNRLKQSARFIERAFSGGFVVNVVVRTGRPGGALQPEVLRFTHELLGELERDPIVDRTISLLDYFALMDAALHPEESPHPVPESRGQAAQYLLLYESGGDPDDLASYVNFERSALNLLVRADAGSSEMTALGRRVEAFAERAPPGVEVRTLGSAYLYACAMDGITRAVVVGLLTATALIAAVMWATLRSARLALIAMLPNLLPVVLGAGILGWLGIPLAMATSVVGCIALGLAVDDTAHVMGHLARAHALEDVYRAVGRPLILTTAALGIGFSALLLSEFQTVRILGAATALTLVVALFADLVLLPALLRTQGFRLVSSDAPPHDGA